MERGNTAIPPATVLHFCNLQYAAKLLQVAPDYLSRMPCRLAVRQQNKQVMVDIWMLPENDQRFTELAKKINTIIKTIVEQGIE